MPLPSDFVIRWLRSCPFASVRFPCFFSDRTPGFIWFGSVYLVTDADFEAGQVIGDEQQQQQQ